MSSNAMCSHSFDNSVYQKRNVSEPVSNNMELHFKLVYNIEKKNLIYKLLLQ